MNLSNMLVLRIPGNNEITSYYIFVLHLNIKEQLLTNDSFICAFDVADAH